MRRSTRHLSDDRLQALLGKRPPKSLVAGAVGYVYARSLSHATSSADEVELLWQENAALRAQIAWLTPLGPKIGYAV